MGCDAFRARAAPSHADAQPLTRLQPQQLEAAFNASCHCRPQKAIRKFTSLPFNETECRDECRGRTSFSNKADVWSLGIVLYELFHGEMLSCHKDKRVSWLETPTTLPEDSTVSAQRPLIQSTLVTARPRG